MNRLSRISLVLICFFIFSAGFLYYPKWKQTHTEATISWDVSGYYFYLPSCFIYRDLMQLGFKDSILNKYHPTPELQQAFLHGSGNYVMKYSAGQAILFSPFFLVAHAVAGLSEQYPADGFSYPYQYCIGIGMLLYACAGILVLRKVLLHFFSDAVTALTLLAVFFATNYLDYSVIDGAMTHNSLFMLYALLLLFTIRFYRKPALRYAMAIGFTAGMATLVRPTEAICVLIPLCWGMAGAGKIKKRISFLINNRSFVVPAGIIFLLVVFIQSAYWKYVSGSWIVYSYGNEGFDWLQPHIINGLLSYKNGWLVYTPVMLLMVPGFICFYKQQRELFFAVSLFTCLFIYTCFSWHQWWYGASLGQRAMIQAYPVLALPLGSFFCYVQRKRLLFAMLIVFLAGCTWYNLWLTHQSHKGGYFRAGEMNGAYLRAIVFSTNLSPEIQLLLDNEEIYSKNTRPKNSQLATRGKIQIDTDHPSSAEYDVTIAPGTKWLRASALISMPVKEWDTWKMPQFILRFYAGEKIIKTSFIRAARALSDGETKQLHFDASVPDEKTDRCTVLFWNAGSDKKLRADSVEVTSF
jgi:hypothetical protein